MKVQQKNKSLLQHLSSIRVYVTLLIFTFGCLSLTGCRSGCCTFNLPTLCHCGCGREPPVMYSEYPYVIDYMPEDECGSCFEEEECDEGEPISPELTDTSKPILDEYHIAVGDVLEISVFGDEDTLVDNTIVAPDGRIYYLFLDGIQAEGKTVEELRKVVESGLSSMFLAPTVSIIPQIMSKNTFTILGRVRRPGLYPLTQIVTVRQALGLAGGLLLEPELITGSDQTNRLFIQSGRSGRFYAQANMGRNEEIYNLKDSFLVRNGEKIRIDFENLVYSGDQSQNVVIRPGDYIYIAPDEDREVFVLGAVNAATAVPYEKNMSVLKALASSGGWRMGGPYGADMQNVLILRGDLDCPTVARLDLAAIIRGEARDIALQPGDILYVHNKKFRFGRELVQLAVTAFIQSFLNDAAIQFADTHLGNNL